MSHPGRAGGRRPDPSDVRRAASRFRFGIEHEIAFLDGSGRFADFTCTSFEDFDRIIRRLPLYPDDYPQLRIGDAGIKVKRWYVEGFERFAHSGQPVGCVPKGIEIRTTIHPTIRGAVSELHASLRLLNRLAQRHGFRPVPVAFHPFKTVFVPDPPLNDYELKRRESSTEKLTAAIPMLTYGPDLNLSVDGMEMSTLVDTGMKLTYYSPAIIPFSFSSPFYAGRLWDGLSVRTAIRTGERPAALVFVDDPSALIDCAPSLTKLARLPAEVGRIEFKACDACGDFNRYASLLALLKGLVCDRSLPGRAQVPDPVLHQRSARHGFEDATVYRQAGTILRAARQALDSDPDAALLDPLERALSVRCTPAHALRVDHDETGDLTAVLKRLAGGDHAPVGTLQAPTFIEAAHA